MNIIQSYPLRRALKAMMVLVAIISSIVIHVRVLTKLAGIENSLATPPVQALHMIQGTIQESDDHRFSVMVIHEGIRIYLPEEYKKSIGLNATFLITFGRSGRYQIIDSQINDAELYRGLPEIKMHEVDLSGIHSTAPLACSNQLIIGSIRPPTNDDLLSF